jgi:hypothetical protein
LFIGRRVKVPATFSQSIYAPTLTAPLALCAVQKLTFLHIKQQPTTSTSSALQKSRAKMNEHLNIR